MQYRMENSTYDSLLRQKLILPFTSLWDTHLVSKLKESGTFQARINMDSNLMVNFFKIAPTTPSFTGTRDLSNVYHITALSSAKELVLITLHLVPSIISRQAKSLNFDMQCTDQFFFAFPLQE